METIEQAHQHTDPGIPEKKIEKHHDQCRIEYMQKQTGLVKRPKIFTRPARSKSSISEIMDSGW